MLTESQSWCRKEDTEREAARRLRSLWLLALTPERWASLLRALPSSGDNSFSVSEEWWNEFNFFLGTLFLRKLYLKNFNCKYFNCKDFKNIWFNTRGKCFIKNAKMQYGSNNRLTGIRLSHDYWRVRCLLLQIIINSRGIRLNASNSFELNKNIT